MGDEFLPADFSKSAVADLKKSANLEGFLPADLSKSTNWGKFLPADFIKSANWGDFC